MNLSSSYVDKLVRSSIVKFVKNLSTNNYNINSTKEVKERKPSLTVRDETASLPGGDLIGVDWPRVRRGGGGSDGQE